MGVRDEVLGRLRSAETGNDEVRFAAIGGPLEAIWREALRELDRSIRPVTGAAAVLVEGADYPGTWLESTATISTDVLARFRPDVARETHLLFARLQRDDGMLPYKITDDGPAFSQIQLVSPLARSVWTQYRLGVGGTEYLRTMYDAMAKYDAWLCDYRDTRGTGAVEAFCTFDTGHDLSPRFWFLPDRAMHADARRYDPAYPTLPYVAPDLTANVACQRSYLAMIAAELGLDPEPWRRKAAASTAALFAQCFDEYDAAFYDRDAHGEPVRMLTDVMLRVFACEVGDAALFETVLRRYLMNTRVFLAHYGFTSLAMDDPRFDHDFTRNSWGGPSNLLSLLRSPHAFEHHGHVAELALASQPVVAAIAGADRFPQCLDPWSGAAGYGSAYSPAILWFLDAVERYFGVMPAPAGLWFSGLTPTRLEHGTAATATAHSRTVDGVTFELVGDDAAVTVYRDGAELLAFPRGWRVEADRDGTPRTVVCLAAVPVAGELVIDGHATTLAVAPNERVEIASGRCGGPAFIPPRF